MNGFTVLLPEIFLSISGCFLLIMGLFTPRITKFLGIIVIVASLFLVKIFVPNGEVIVFSNLFKTNFIIKNLKFVLLSSAFIYLIAYNFLSLRNSFLKQYEFTILIIFCLVGMMVMLSSNNFLSLYVGIELQSLCIAVLASFEKEDTKSSEAGIKYFILAAFASGLLLFGISLIYGFTGNLDFSKFQTFLTNNPSSEVAIAVTIGIVLVLIGLFFKTSAAPFHMWTPDVFQGSPTIVTSLLATISKIAAVGVLLLLSGITFKSWSTDLQPIYIVITIVSVLIGAIGALNQQNLKRMLAYSSIGHVGFMLLAISSFSLSLNVIIYLVIYFTMTFGTFLLLMNSYVNEKPVGNIEDLKGIAKTHPKIAAAYGIFMFSLAGIPPFAGFFAKFYVFNIAINSGLYITTIISVIAAVIAAFYYLRIVKVIYLDEPSGSFIYEGNALPIKSILIAFTLFNLCYILMS